MSALPRTLVPPRPLLISASVGGGERPQASGKFLFLGSQKFYVRGVTYGPFRPDETGQEYRTPESVERDFREIAAHGMNAVRAYTVPPRWLLDVAQRHGLRVMVGLPWEQHVAFLEDRARPRDIEARVRRWVRACAGHPAVLCYSIGNEIPAPIVRWHGRRRVERFLERLYHAAKDEDPSALVTYVNYPTTEYLDLPFVDVVSFNVYLEAQDRLEAYLARLQNVAGDRPLLMAEIGLDSRRNGEAAQAQALDWQVRATFAAGGAGAFVFSWTDEWHTGGRDVDDWDFGLTARDRAPKPALAAVRRAFAESPFPARADWPRVSVIVCSRNGAATLRDCFDGLSTLDYPDREVIVVDDGSTDATPALAREYGFRLISTPNRGLSAARNTGLDAATGEIVAYLDDDAFPDPHWLTYLALAFRTSPHAGIGGPNLPPPADGLLAGCVARAPGGPTHILLSDTVAEHIPGCNMAFRKSCLQAVGGFDPQFRIAGDDVDVCWRIQGRGWTLGFSPAAVVWHHRRQSLRKYWKQQWGYGRAEALLERKWPEKYNRAGHLSWSGRLYGPGAARVLNGWRARVYQGVWGSAPFQSLYQPGPGLFGWIGQVAEWYLIVGGLAALAALGMLWAPLRLLLPLLALASAVPLVFASAGASSALRGRRPAGPAGVAQWGLTALLHMLQPLARLAGRMSHGLTPLRRRGVRGWVVPRPRQFRVWSEAWRSAHARLESFESALRAQGAVVRRGGEFDPWDLEARGGLFASARLRMAIEEYPGGRQLVRFRAWPRWSPAGVALPSSVLALAARAFGDGAWAAAALLGALGAAWFLRNLWEAAGAMASIVRALEGRMKDEGGSRRSEVGF